MNGLRGLKVLTSSNLIGAGQYFNLPSIGGLYTPRKKTFSFSKENKFTMVLQMLDMFKFGIPIYPDTYEESGGNDISEQVLVGGIGSDSPSDTTPGDDVAASALFSPPEE